MKTRRRWLNLMTAIAGASVIGCSPAEAAAPAEAYWTLEVQELFGDEESVPLTHVYRIAAHGDGSIVIADGPPARAVLFRSGGGVVPIGAVGGGPGEYSYINDVGFVGDSLWVTDARNSRAIFFDMQGKALGTERITVDPRDRDERSAGPIRPLSDGSWTASVSGVSITGVLNGWVTTRLYYRVVGDSIVRVFAQPLPKTDYMGVKVGAGRFESLHPLPSGPIFHTAVDGRSHFVVDRNVATEPDAGVFSIHRLSLRGDTLWTRGFDYSPIRVSDEWVENWIRMWRERMAGWLDVPEGQLDAAFRESVEMPEFFPPIADFRTGTDGRLWLRETLPDTMKVRWLVLDSVGHELGRLRAPDGFRLLLPTSTDVYGVVKNDFDVETVVRAVIGTAYPDGLQNGLP